MADNQQQGLNIPTAEQLSEIRKQKIAESDRQIAIKQVQIIETAFKNYSGDKEFVTFEFDEPLNNIIRSQLTNKGYYIVEKYTIGDDNKLKKWIVNASIRPIYNNSIECKFHPYHPVNDIFDVMAYYMLYNQGGRT